MARKASPKKPTKPAPKRAAAKKYDESTSAEHVRKEYLIRRINERIASVVRHAGVNNEEVMRWQAKLGRPGSPFITKVTTYDPSKIKSAKNRGYQEKVEYYQISRRKKDIENMSYEALLRLDQQTRGWGAVKAEAKKALQQQAQARADINPFAPTEPPEITEEDVLEYIDQKEAIREYIEGNSEHFYALIESTGWDDIRDHSTEEIYNEIQRLQRQGGFRFGRTQSEISEDYIRRREASRERRRQLGF